MDDLGRYLSPQQPQSVQAMPAVAPVPSAAPTITYMEPMAPANAAAINNEASDSRCILCDSYISDQADPPAGINIHGFRLSGSQETISDKLETVLRPVCAAGASLQHATALWRMKHICMACSAALMTLDTYENKILEIREELKRRFVDVLKARAPHYGPLQPTYHISQSVSSADNGVGHSVHVQHASTSTASTLVMVDGSCLAPVYTNSSTASSVTTDGTISEPSSHDQAGASSAVVGQFVCSICNKSFRNKYNLKRHAGMHTGLRPFSCAHCPRTFRQKDHLKTHLRAGANDAPLTCHLCGGGFACFTLLSEHRRRDHQDLGEHGCRHCDQVFSTPTELRRHTRQVHPHPVRAEFRCALCGRAFPNGYNLRRHARTHSGERPFGCTVCGKRFTQLCILKKHELVHKKLPHVREIINSI